MTLTEIKRDWPLGSIVSNYGEDYYIIGYRVNDNFDYIVGAYVDNDNGDHNLIRHFKTAIHNYLFIEEGIKKSNIPLNRHINIFPTSRLKMVKKSSCYNWIEL